MSSSHARLQDAGPLGAAVPLTMAWWSSSAGVQAGSGVTIHGLMFPSSEDIGTCVG